MRWFPDQDSVSRWGSPNTRYPLKVESFLLDMYWGKISSRIALHTDGRLLGFGQFYPKLERCHLARLIIGPAFRGQGLGFRFIAALMRYGSEQLGAEAFSLFVMADNKPALGCYKNLGFKVAAYPEDDLLLENCLFMVK